MKKILILLVTIVCMASGCKDKFTDMNMSPDAITQADLDFLFTQALANSYFDTYGEWFFHTAPYNFRAVQYTVGESGNESQNLKNTPGSNNRLNSVLPNTFEIRRIIDEKPEEEKANYAKYRALTYIPQVMHALEATDLNGPVVYSQAMRGRYEKEVEAEFDQQDALYDVLLAELDDAITTLMSNQLGEQVKVGNKQDFIYNSDWAKWARFANSLKLRIASRLETNNLTKAKEVISSVMSSPAGIIETLDQEPVHGPDPEWRGDIKDAIDYNATSAAKNMVDFLVANKDPRVRIFYARNDFDAEVMGIYETNGGAVPQPMLDRMAQLAGDPDSALYVQYVGGPVNPQERDNLHYYNLPQVGGQSYSLLSPNNQKLFRPNLNFQGVTADGRFVEVYMNSAEVCLFVAEFIEKGYISGQGTAQAWLDKGVRNSCARYDNLADMAIIPHYSEIKIKNEEVDALLDRPVCDLSTGNAMEKIAIQQHLNFYRNPTRAYANCMRTGYPKKNSEFLAWEPIMDDDGTEIKLSRRNAKGIYTIEINKDNYNNAMQEAGFTIGALDNVTLNVERVWWDKGNPSFGGGQ